MSSLADRQAQTAAAGSGTNRLATPENLVGSSRVVALRTL
jgi:hypothetical protein